MQVSVVVRSKNEERFIGSVLERVLEQEFADPYEVILLDSGLQDRTLEVMRSFPVRLGINYHNGNSRREHDAAKLCVQAGIILGTHRRAGHVSTPANR